MSAPQLIDDKLRARIEYAKRLPGSIVVGLGPGGCGKTDTASRVSMACAYLNGIDWWGYDSNGDVHKHLNGVERFHKNAYEAAGNASERAMHWKKLEFVQKCKAQLFRGSKKLAKLQSTVLGWIEEGIANSDTAMGTKARTVLFLDEAGAIRDFDADFWPAMRQARNAGITIYTTGHRMVDWHPATRANVRVLMLWQPMDGRGYEINGSKIPRSECAISGGPMIHYFISGEVKPRLWNRGANPSQYPVELVTPATPTIARVAGF